MRVGCLDLSLLPLWAPRVLAQGSHGARMPPGRSADFAGDTGATGTAVMGDKTHSGHQVPAPLLYWGGREP